MSRLNSPEPDSPDTLGISPPPSPRTEQQRGGIEDLFGLFLQGSSTQNDLLRSFNTVLLPMLKNSNRTASTKTTASSSLTPIQTKNIRHCFSIVNCDEHVEKFLRIFNERSIPFGTVSAKQFLDVILLFLTEIEYVPAVKLSNLLAMSWE